MNLLLPSPPHPPRKKTLLRTVPPDVSPFSARTMLRIQFVSRSSSVTSLGTWLPLFDLISFKKSILISFSPHLIFTVRGRTALITLLVPTDPASWSSEGGCSSHLTKLSAISWRHCVMHRTDATWWRDSLFSRHILVGGYEPHGDIETVDCPMPCYRNAEEHFDVNNVIN